MGEVDAYGIVEGVDYNSVCPFVCTHRHPLRVTTFLLHHSQDLLPPLLENNATQRDGPCELKQASAKEPNATLGKSIII